MPPPPRPRPQVGDPLALVQWIPDSSLSVIIGPITSRSQKQKTYDAQQIRTSPVMLDPLGTRPERVGLDAVCRVPVTPRDDQRVGGAVVVAAGVETERLRSRRPISPRPGRRAPRPDCASQRPVARQAGRSLPKPAHRSRDAVRVRPRDAQRRETGFPIGSSCVLANTRLIMDLSDIRVSRSKMGRPDST